MEFVKRWLLERLSEYTARLSWFEGKLSSTDGPYFDLLCEVRMMKLDVLGAGKVCEIEKWLSENMDRLNNIRQGIAELEEEFSISQEEYKMISEELRRLSGEDNDSMLSWGDVPVEKVQKRAREEEEVEKEEEEEEAVETPRKKRSVPKIAPGFENFPIMTNKPYRRPQRGARKDKPAGNEIV